MSLPLVFMTKADQLSELFARCSARNHPRRAKALGEFLGQSFKANAKLFSTTAGSFDASRLCPAQRAVPSARRRLSLCAAKEAAVALIDGSRFIVNSIRPWNFNESNGAMPAVLAVPLRRNSPNSICDNRPPDGELGW